MPTPMYPDYAARTPSLWDRVLGRLPRRNALAELTALLASRGDPARVDATEVDSIASKYRLNLLGIFPSECTAIYASFLKWCLSDGKITEEEASSLQHLRELLRIPPDRAEKVYQEAARPYYQRALEADIAAPSHDERRMNFINELQAQLKLSDTAEAELRKETINSALTKLVNVAVADQRLTPDEEEQLGSLASRYGIKLEFESATRAMLDRYRYYWIAESGPLPVLQTGINLQKNEICHLETQVSWYELRAVSHRYNYSGPTARIRLAKGLYWRVGSVNVTAIPKEQLSLIDTGQLLLTSSRLIFIGARKTTSILYRRVLAFHPVQIQSKIGFELEKDGGKSPVLIPACDAVGFGILLERLLNVGKS